jgi:proteasome lid subunit RPN8/RPN11
MITIWLSPESVQTMLSVCLRAGSRETGGMLFAENTGPHAFHVAEVTTSPVGRFASFIRVITDGLARLEEFFRRTHYDYTRFNYLGEWHSHPAFALEPSRTDDATMHEIAGDPGTRALFVVLMIVKVEGEMLEARAWAYFPGDGRQDCEVAMDGSSGEEKPRDVLRRMPS